LLRQGELRLADLLTISVASDQRATTLGSAFGALAAALFAADATLLTIQAFDVPAAVSIAIASLGSVIASLLCFYAGRPIDFYVGGYEPQRLLPAASNDIWLLRYICQDIQQRIDLDKAALERSARVTTTATIVEISSIFVAAIAFATLHIMRGAAIRRKTCGV